MSALDCFKDNIISKLTVQNCLITAQNLSRYSTETHIQPAGVKSEAC